MNQLTNFTKGFIKENPVFVLLLGLCPTLGVTSTAINGLGMGLATTFVLVMSNLVVSIIKSMIPDKVRIPAFIVIIASFVTIVELTMQAYTPALFEALGLFIPLIVVNCIVLGRAEAFASKQSILVIYCGWVGHGAWFFLRLNLTRWCTGVAGKRQYFRLRIAAGRFDACFRAGTGRFHCPGLLNRINEQSC